MNNFTKTELNEIKRCLKFMIDGGATPYSCLTISLHKKIREMIDTYCDHEWLNGTYCEKCNWSPVE